VRVAYSADASRNLENIIAVIAKDFPSAYDGFVARLGAIERQIALWPNSARLVAGRAGVRMVPLVRYPYRLFYTVLPDAVYVLHVEHAARMSGPISL